MLVRMGLAIALALLAASTAVAAGGEVRIAYLGQAVEHPPVLSNLEPPPDDEGLQGARLGVSDSSSTGRFLGQRYALDPLVLASDGDIAAAVDELVRRGHRFVVADLRPAGLDAALAAPGAEALLFFNAGAADDRFRGADCRPNLLHTLPSRAMLADALAQFLIAKRWPRWLLVVGPRPEDAFYANAVRRAAKRFGGRIVAERVWTGASDLRRSARNEVAPFTRGVDYDVLIVADEIGDFGEYLPYQTAAPRPVAGTQGLKPLAWHRTVEQWGASQLQNRFRSLAGRPMTARDYAAWLAVRAIGEAASRAGTDPARLEAHLRGPDFQLAAFKGRAASFRDWDGQMRQPIVLAGDRALVGTAPMEGFLHPADEMDTLGHDRPEAACKVEKRT